MKLKTNEVYLFSITEQRPAPYDGDEYYWTDKYTEKMVFDSLDKLRQYIYSWYEGKQKALARVVENGRAEMEMTHHLDLQALENNLGRTDMLPFIMIRYFTPSGNPRKRYMIGSGNAYPIKLNPKTITE